MHELGMAQEILNIVTQTLSAHPGKKLLSVNVRIGEMNAVVPELLDTAYQGLVRDTPLQYSKIIIQNVPVMGTCLDCRAEITPKTFVYACPQCGSVNIKITQGDELYIQDLEVE